jgi:hypothetical protein
MSDSIRPWTRRQRHALAGPLCRVGDPLLFTVAALVLLLLVHAYAVQSDLAADDENQGVLAAGDALATARLEAAMRREFAPRVAAAYAQGQRDAMASVQGRPQGVALVQACLALRESRP